MVPEFLVEGRDAPLEVEHVSSVKLLTHVDPHPGVEGSLFHSATSAFLCFIQALGAPRRQLPTHSEFSSPISNLAIGVSSLEGPRGDSSTTISHGEVFWSHPRPPWASSRICTSDDTYEGREVFSEGDPSGGCPRIPCVLPPRHRRLSRRDAGQRKGGRSRRGTPKKGSGRHKARSIQ